MILLGFSATGLTLSTYCVHTTSFLKGERGVDSKTSEALTPWTDVLMTPTSCGQLPW